MEHHATTDGLRPCIRFVMCSGFVGFICVYVDDENKWNYILCRVLCIELLGTYVCVSLYISSLCF
jgi:hypothetical protein